MYTDFILFYGKWRNKGVHSYRKQEEWRFSHTNKTLTDLVRLFPKYCPNAPILVSMTAMHRHVSMRPMHVRSIDQRYRDW